MKKILNKPATRLATWVLFFLVAIFAGYNFGKDIAIKQNNRGLAAECVLPEC